MKTFIRQPGNKTRYIKYILPLLPNEYKTYFEPFVGTGALFLHVQPDKWVINDNNDDLMNLYRVVRDDSSNLIKSLKSFGTRTDFKNMTNEDRSILMKHYMQLFVSLPFDTKRAMYYVILKHSAFNGIILENGRYVFKSLDLDLLKDRQPSFLIETYFKKIKDASKLLNKNGKIYSGDYKRVLKMAKKGDFCFIDPPYIENHDYKFTYNTKAQFNTTNFIDELYIELKKLDKKQVKWLMTQADTIEVRNKFKEYFIIDFPVYRPITKVHKTELIIKNY